MRHPTTCFDHAIPGGQLPWTRYNHSIFSVNATFSDRENVLGTTFVAMFIFCTHQGLRTLADYNTRSKMPRRVLTKDGVGRWNGESSKKV